MSTIIEDSLVVEAINPTVNYIVNGFISPVEIAEAAHLVEAAYIQNQSQVNVCIDIQHFNGWSDAGALLKELKDRSGILKKIDKVAIVTTNNWTAKIAGAANLLSPNIEMKIFKPAEKQAALHWLETTVLENDSTLSDDDILSVQEYSTDNNRIVGFSLDGES